MKFYSLVLVYCLSFCELPFEMAKAANATKTELKLALITPFSGEYGFERLACASTMAIDKAKEDGYLQDIDVRFIWKNGNCNGKLALGVTVDLRYNENVDGYIGLPCSVAAINAGKIIAYWNLPHFSFSSTDPRLADKHMYNTLIRVISPFNRLGSAMVELFTYYHWNRVIILTGEEEDAFGYCEFSALAMEREFRDFNITLVEWVEVGMRPSDRQLRFYLNKIQSTARIVIICGSIAFLRRFMLLAQKEDMTKGDYVFIMPGLLPWENIKSLWKLGDNRDEEASRAFQPLLLMTLGVVSEEHTEDFLSQIPYKMAEPPWNYNGTLLTGQKGTPFAMFLYDSVYMYSVVVDKAYRRGGEKNIRNGTHLFELAKTTTFQGKSGVVMLDNNGDRIGDYKLWHINPSSRNYETMMDIQMTQKSGQKIKLLQTRVWGNTGTAPPADTPKCGFNEEHCPKDTSTQDIIIIAVALVILVIVGIITISIVYYRRKKFEEELELMLWKVKYDDIEFVNNKTRGSMSSLSERISSTSTMSTTVRGANNDTGPVRLGYFKGSLVAVKLLQKTGVLLTRHDHIELKAMRDIQHENINPFIGACVDPPNICILTKYCSKGSLQDILENDDIKLDGNFKNSLLGDLIHGLDYFHKTSLKSHGRLSTTNCVIDGRWVLKITDWGLACLREHHYETENEKHTAMFFTSPELLRDVSPPVSGTQKGDVYSFSIILHGILHRVSPYQNAAALNMIPKDIVGRVRNGETPPFRPEIAPEDKADQRLTELMQDCWAEDPAARPDMAGIKNRFSAINKGKRFNIMDNMLRMMEKYANNLEELIGDRTRQLMEEKKKTDLLLYRMLPSMVADALKSGKSVKPELHPKVSVYFSDIVSFTTLASESSPMEVVDFLNDLWTLFDDFIAKYDVYKVETIGDAYMVCSGLPVPNELGHASEIADMALEILSSVLTFKIRHRPEQQLQVRIGIHSGPVVAGVVGQTMPRYCLFGDTVNTASRMESNGEPLRIHLSSQSCNELNNTNSKYIVTSRGEIEIKGKGLQVTYWLEGKEGYTRPLPRFTD